ncbi:hypothetical protein [Janibacter melonis]|uniref:hypothetical protein n=1 Tax=Janibacter melonis TaxID=262209 RepID=UPI00191B891A|nr:hypothetical protein [Janibacter melonis]
MTNTTNRHPAPRSVTTSRSTHVSTFDPFAIATSCPSRALAGGVPQWNLASHRRSAVEAAFGALKAGER